MSGQTVYQQNVFFKPMQFLYDLLSTNIPDPNQDRSSQVNPKARQWLFPEVPEANDENYPRIAIIPGQVTLQEYGAGRYIETVTDGNGDWVSETRGVIASIPVTIGVFVKKKQVHNVEELDGAIVAMQNKKLADYLAYEVLRVLVGKRPSFIKENMDVQEITATEAYEDNQFLYAADVTFTLVEWLAIEERFDPASLIRQIDLTIDAGSPTPPPPIHPPPTVTAPVFSPSPIDPVAPTFASTTYSSPLSLTGSVTFVWKVNGATIRTITLSGITTGSTVTDDIPAASFVDGDELSVTVTPNDGVVSGTSATTTEIAPLPPPAFLFEDDAELGDTPTITGWVGV
jgi:hypothetical protein